MLQDEQTLRAYLSSNSPIYQDDIARGFLLEDLHLLRIGLSCISAAYGYVFFIARWNWQLDIWFAAPGKKGRAQEWELFVRESKSRGKLRSVKKMKVFFWCTLWRTLSYCATVLNLSDLPPGLISAIPPRPHPTTTGFHFSPEEKEHRCGKVTFS